MNRLHRYTLIVLTCQLLFAGCRARVSCADTYLTPAFIGYQLSDLDTVIVRRYAAGNFSQLLDTALLRFDTAYLRSTRSHDTTWVLLNHISGQEQYLFPGHDWQVVVPATSSLLSFSAITSPKTESSCFKCQCWNPIQSFVLNNQAIAPTISQIPYTGGNFYSAFFHR